MTTTKTNEKKSKFNVGDIIEVSMQIEYTSSTTTYKIHYSYPQTKGFKETEFEVDANCSSSFGNDIKQYLKELLKDDITEIAEYELIDIDNKGEYQTAKVKIKSLN